MTEFLKTIFTPIQFVGYAGMLCAFLSFQCKKNRNFFVCQTLCSVFFGLQFALLGGWSGFLSNLLGIARGVVLARGPRLHKRPVLVGLGIAFLASLVLSVTIFDEPLWISSLLFIAQAGGTLAMWTDNGKYIRLFQFFASSPIWLIHNIFYAFSMGGILCESFNMASVVISFIRFRKTGFDSSETAHTDPPT